VKKVLFVASECVPFIKTGGLADVVGSLPKCFDRDEFDIRVIIPKYTAIDEKLKSKVNYITNFEIDLHWRKQYVGLFDMVYEGVRFYFIDNEYYFGGFNPYGNINEDIEKFAYFSKAVLSCLPILDFKPDIIHCHDWQTGLIPVLLKDIFSRNEFYRGIKSIMTIHNLKFQGR
jgi:starch synthase